MIRYLLLVCVLISSLSFSANAQSRKKRKKIDKVLTEARSYYGTRYLYGGTTRNGIDCSGLIYNCFQKADITLPRTSQSQSKVGKRKGWGSVRPGDIVYFKFKEKGNKWYHSGVISYKKNGEIKFIHASTSKGVIESSMSLDYYKKNVKKFRRVI